MAGIATAVNGIIQRIDRDAGGGACSTGMTGRASSCHCDSLAMINAVSGMNSQPIAAMASITVPRSAAGQTNQQPATGLVMTEGAVIVMNSGDGIPGIMATLAGVIVCGNNLGSMSAIYIVVRISGAVTGVTIIEGIGYRHGLTRGYANQGDRGGGTKVTGRAAIVQFGVSGTRRKYRRMAVNSAGSPNKLTAIFIGADIKCLVIVRVVSVTVQTGDRMLGIGLTYDIGNGGVGRSDINGATGVVTESAIILMLDQDIVPGSKPPVTAIMAGSAGLSGIGVRAEADCMIFVAATGTVIVVVKIADMALDALAIRRSGAGSRTFQSTIGGQIMAGGATARGMGLARANEGRDRGAVATSAVGGHRRQGSIGGYHRGMTVGMAAKIGRMTVGAGGGGFTVTECCAGRVESNTSPQVGGGGVAGLTVIGMDGKRAVSQMLVAVGAGRGVGQEIMGRKLEPLCRVMAFGAFLGGIMSVMRSILSPVTCFRVANLADALAGCFLVGETTLTITGIGIKKGHSLCSRRRRFDVLPDQLPVDETKGTPSSGRRHRAFYSYDAIVGTNYLVGAGILISIDNQDQAPV